MKPARTAAAKWAAMVLGGGIVMGVLMAATVPTTIRKHDGDDWRDKAGAGAYMGAADPSDNAIAYEAPPEDLTPIAWDAAAARKVEAWRDPPEHAAIVTERLPDVLLDGDATPPRDDEGADALAAVPGDGAPLGDDEAASSAQAAREAAADVRAGESVAAQRAGDDSAPATGT